MMSSLDSFTAKLIRTGSGYGAGATALPADLKLVPQLWSASDRGGCKQAELTATGSAESLASLSAWLGDRVEIYNEQGDLLWWGVLWDMEIAIGRILLTITLDSVYNRVAVTYAAQQPDGSEESRTTEWVQDDQSVLRYGKRELLYGLPASFTRSAEEVRSLLLERFRTAAPALATQAGSETGARLIARGLWDKAGAVYFTNPDGLVEYQDESGTQVIGRYLQSTAISFGTATNGGAGEEGEMWIGGGATFEPLVPGDEITISGAAQANNNGSYSIDKMDSNTQIGISGAFEAETAGATVRVSYGSNISYDNVIQSFMTDTSWTATHVAVKVRKLGNPSDSFRIGIYPDSGSGTPGTVLTAKEVLGSTLFTELTWMEFEFDTPVALTAGTLYHIGMRRTGSASLADGYEIAIDEEAGYADGQMAVYTGSTWIQHNPNADLPFRVIGEISSTAQLVKALDVVDAVNNILVQLDSEVPVRQFVDDPRIALDEIEQMLDAGTSSGERLVAWVERDNSVIVGLPIVNGYGGTNLVLGDDGQLRYASGRLYAPGRLIYGRYIEIDSLALQAGLGIYGTRGEGVYIAESQFEASSGVLTVAGDGVPDPFKAITMRIG